MAARTASTAEGASTPAIAQAKGLHDTVFGLRKPPTLESDAAASTEGANGTMRSDTCAPPENLRSTGQRGVIRLITPFLSRIAP